jgi:hypothetical protein
MTKKKTKTSRKPTRYWILLSDSEKGEFWISSLNLCGAVDALTPSQARRKAIRELPIVKSVLEAKGAQMMYAIPDQSFSPTSVALEKVDRIVEEVGADD